MKTQKPNPIINKLSKSNLGVLLVFCVALYGLAILQDYIFSQVRHTGFYWSDTMLYNIYWLLFVPFIKIASAYYYKIRFRSLTHKILYALSTGIGLSLLHIFVFTSIFILGSHIIFSEPHRFSRILKNAFSNQLQITIIAYLFSPLLFDYLKRKKQAHETSSTVKTAETITVKDGTRRIKIETSTILFIQTERPYTMVHTIHQKVLHDESLKQLESILDSQVFFRVHRSAIVNKNHIVELKSRKNGDYDAVLTNEQSIRFSRHYRQNWSELLNH